VTPTVIAVIDVDIGVKVTVDVDVAINVTVDVAIDISILVDIAVDTLVAADARVGHSTVHLSCSAPTTTLNSGSTPSSASSSALSLDI
jgi:hypothetical protein